MHTEECHRLIEGMGCRSLQACPALPHTGKHNKETPMGVLFVFVVVWLLIWWQNRACLQTAAANDWSLTGSCLHS